MDEYYVATLGREDEGPFTLSDLSQKAQTGSIQPETQIKCPGGIVVPASMVSGIEGLSRQLNPPIPQYTGALPYAQPVPKEMNSGFNFGAFFTTWIWGFVHRAPMSLVAIGLDLIAIASIVLFAMKYIPHEGLQAVTICHLPMMVWFGVQGNKWAWASEKYETAEECKAAQKKWAWTGGIGVGLITSVAFLCLVYFVVTAMHDGNEALRIMDEISHPNPNGE